MKDNLDNIFKNLENQFDIEEPDFGHFNRFEEKLNANEGKKTAKSNRTFLYYISIAASITLIFGIWIGASFSHKGMELANVSKEMEETQSYFIATIHKELETVEKERNNDTNIIINDALEQIKILETQYQKLTVELKESNGDKRVIYAMISNFQQRIDILQNLLDQIKEVKQLKKQNNEIYA